MIDCSHLPGDNPARINSQPTIGPNKRRPGRHRYPAGPSCLALYPASFLAIIAFCSCFFDMPSL